MRGITVAKTYRAVSIITLLLVFSQAVFSAESDQFEKGLDAYNQGDYQSAYKIISPIASKGDPSALNLLGMMNELGLGIPKNAKKAVTYYRQAADKGYSYAQYNLAVSYDTGVGVPINYREAVKWYERAAKQGASFSQYNLGVMYEQGRGTRKDYKKAAYWYQKAAKQGNKQAQNNLAWLYEKGQGLNMDLVSAYVWFEIAAEQGLATAEQKRDLIRRQLDKKELAQASNAIKNYKAQISKNSN